MFKASKIFVLLNCKIISGEKFFLVNMLSSGRTLRSQSIKVEHGNPEKSVKSKSAANVKSIKLKNAAKTDNSVSAKTSIKREDVEYIKAENEVSVPESTQKTGTKTPRKRKLKINMENVKVEKKIDTEENAMQKLVDIEDAAWEPDHWKEVWENILKMRKMHVAPVDSLGCEECPEKESSPEVFRYQTLISVMLSSQTRDEVTYAATQRLIEHGLTVDNILKTSDEKIGELIYPAGFWKSKVQFIKKTTQILKNDYNGDIPCTLKELCKLPGVGPKMANIVMSVGWNQTVGIAVDTHVHRISNRLGWVKKPTKTPEQTRVALESWLPKELWKDGSFHLVGFGQTICKPTNPKCQECLNINLCPIGRNNSKKTRNK